MQTYLVSFGSSYNYAGACNRVHEQSQLWKSKGLLTDCVVTNESILAQYYPQFIEQHLEHISHNPRGFGYWIWKSFLVKQVMAQVPQDSLVFWMDVGCQLNDKASVRFSQYQQMAFDTNILCFDVGMPEYQWTKADTAWRVCNNNESYMNTGQIISGIVFWKNTDSNKKLVDDWHQLSIENNYHYITDAPSQLHSEHWDFRENRHDQSLLSLLIKQSSSYTALPDETYFKNWHVDGINYPVWATRNNSGRLV